VVALLARRGTISVQVLNEFAAVCLGKFGLPVGPVAESLHAIRGVCRVEPLTVETHERGFAIAARYRFAIFDSMLLAAALLAGCRIFYTEDLQHGQLICRQLRVVNPFDVRLG
jgi:predicted nucleic acid-binding protein